MELTTQTIIEYAPLLIIVVAYLSKNKIFVTPEQLVKKEKEIITDVEKRFLTLLEFNEYKKRIDDNNKAINERLDKIENGIEHITEILLQRG